MSGYDTNLAAEFYTLSALYRLGAEATLTLGNKKSVDIIAVRSAGDTVTVDVKGIAGKTGWPVSNVRTDRAKHFVVFVSFLNRIDNPSVSPEVYVVPAHCIPNLRGKGGWRAVHLSTLRKADPSYRDGWKQLL
jgi:hypothetical protein